MPPRKHLPEAPVIFSLRLPSEENIPVPAGTMNTFADVVQTNWSEPTQTATNYADILSTVESSRVAERFSTETMKDILSRTRTPTYGPTSACMWCCHPFPWKASVLPVSYDAYENMYTCEGNYCSPECALSYLYNDIALSDVSRWSRHALLSDLYRSLYDNKILTPAPHRHMLRMFGGPLDIEQFREYVANSEDMIAVQLPPLRLHVPSMNVQGPIRDVKKFVSLSQETVDKASKELRLRRTKPVHQTGATLDKCITSYGIIV
jgi:hypothetical protein